MGKLWIRLIDLARQSHKRMRLSWDPFEVLLLCTQTIKVASRTTGGLRSTQSWTWTETDQNAHTGDAYAWAQGQGSKGSGEGSMPHMDITFELSLSWESLVWEDGKPLRANDNLGLSTISLPAHTFLSSSCSLCRSASTLQL